MYADNTMSENSLNSVYYYYRYFLPSCGAKSSVNFGATIFFFFPIWTPFPSSHKPRCKISDGLNKVLINFFFLSFKHMSMADPSVHIVCELVDLIFRCVCTVAAAHNVCFAFPCCGRPWCAGNWHFVILQQPTNLSTCPVKENKGHFF